MIVDYDIIPGTKLWREAYLVQSAGNDESFWDWALNLGVALSIAGALTSAYNRGNSAGIFEGWGRGVRYTRAVSGY